MRDLDDSIKRLLVEYVNEDDIDRQFEILQRINAMLPESQRLRIPSLVTRDYIRKVLLQIKEGISA